MMNHRLRGVSILLLSGFIASIPLFAQKITGDISGTVSDASGAAVPGAMVQAQNTGTGEKRSVTTNDTGFFRIVDLDRWKLAVSKPWSARPALASPW
jgi:hypothetical protein